MLVTLGHCSWLLYYYSTCRRMHCSSTAPFVSFLTAGYPAEAWNTQGRFQRSPCSADTSPVLSLQHSCHNIVRKAYGRHFQARSKVFKVLHYCSLFVTPKLVGAGYAAKFSRAKRCHLNHWLKLLSPD
jgi:hypothetical protein